jgi:hypothetical protein
VEVVVEMLTGCGAVVAVAAAAAVAAAMRVDVVVVVIVGGVAEAVTRIQHRTPRLRPRAPSTPAELVIPGFVIN